MYTWIVIYDKRRPDKYSDRNFSTIAEAQADCERVMKEKLSWANLQGHDDQYQWARGKNYSASTIPKPKV